MLFRSRLAVVGSVAHLVGKDPGGFLTSGMATEARAIIDYELISSSPGATYQVDFEVRGVPHVTVNVSQRDDYELLTVAEGSPGASATASSRLLNHSYLFDAMCCAND